MDDRLQRWLIRLTAAMMPLLLLVLALRLVTLPWFPTFAYALPFVPDDPYGLTRAERTALARICIADLNLPQGPQWMREARLPDGSVAFTEGELAHMDDVRRLYDRLTRVALLLALMTAAMLYALKRRGGRPAVGEALVMGGVATLGMLPLLAFLIALDWEQFFVGLHHLFFRAGTWRFAYESTLIRLFPEAFWQLAAATVTVLWVAFGAAAIVLGRWLRRTASLPSPLSTEGRER